MAVAVNLGGVQEDAHGLPGIRETLMRSMLVSSHKAAEESLTRADVVIRPKADAVGLLEWHEIDVVRQAGREAALAALPKLRRLVESDPVESRGRTSRH